MVLDKKRTAIVFTANTPQVAEANLYIESLRDPNRGNFQGDIWVISTNLSTRCKNVLDSMDIKYLVNPMMSLYDWRDWRDVAEAQPMFEELSSWERRNNRTAHQIEAFESYRNKRMSKLIIIDWVKKFGSRYDYIVLGDNDLYVQRDIHELFEESYSQDPEVIRYTQEENEIHLGSWVGDKNLAYTEYHNFAGLDWGKREINIGFIMGKPKQISYLFERVKAAFFRCNPKLLIQHNWHDQDFCRLVRAQTPELFGQFQTSRVAHLCSGGEAVIEERLPYQFYHKGTGEKPYIIHFAGGLWKRYYFIRTAYSVDPESWLTSKEREREYEKVRRMKYTDIFNEQSKYYTLNNIRRKDSARKEWLNRDTDKPSILFNGILQMSTHKPLSKMLLPLLKKNNDEYDLICLNGNLVDKDYPDIINEDLPQILAGLTQVTKEPRLIEEFGLNLPWVDQDVVEEARYALKYEYQCNEATALAAANLLYLYYREALLFYQPDVVMLFGYYGPAQRVLRQLCVKMKISHCGFEWTVLPGGWTFDFVGHVGGSCLVENADFYNSLPITDTDLESAEKYLAIVREKALSRSNSTAIENRILARLNSLKESGKKLILFIESNSGHSGNIQADTDSAKRHSPIFYDDVEAYEALLGFAKDNLDYHIVYKPHPISLTRGLRNKLDSSNTTLVEAGSLIELIKICDVSATLLSTGSYDSVFHSKPVVMLGVNQLNISGAAYTLEARELLGTVIREAYERGMTELQQKNLVDHTARIIKYISYVYDESLPNTREIKDIGKDILSIVKGIQAPENKFNRLAYLAQIANREADNESSPIVSFVVSVRNGGNYLNNCINSLIGQTLEEIEIICIDNGSTDDSLSTLNYYAAHDSRITVVEQSDPSQQNQCAGRNLGVDLAKGEFIMFVDADDFIEANTAEALFSACENQNADLMYFWYRDVNTDFVESRPRWRDIAKYFPDEDIFRIDDKYLSLLIGYPFPWAKIIRRSFLAGNGIKFNTDCTRFDDNDHNLHLLLASRNTWVYNRVFYNHRIYDSSMASSVSSENARALYSVQSMNELLLKYGRYFEFQPYYVQFKTHLLQFAWSRLPESSKADYSDKIIDLYIFGDSRFLSDDEAVSYMGIPNEAAIIRAKATLNANSAVSVSDMSAGFSLELKERKGVAKFLIDRYPKAVYRACMIRDSLGLKPKRRQ